MASRRTRIKGIANIPQRRKTSTYAEENPKSPGLEETAETKEPNLTIMHEISCDGNVEQPAVKIAEKFETPTVNKTDTNQDKLVEKEEINMSPRDSPTISENKEILSDLSAESSPNQTNKSGVKPMAVPRRKFIKPNVSLNALSRKPKDADVKTVSPPINNTDAVKNGKIIVLDEVITYSNQNQLVTINDHHRIEDNLLKPPEPGLERFQLNSLDKDIKRIVPTGPQLLSPEVEYPIPPPSPSKINRSRIKAVPRLGQRNTSYSASESEDENRRNYRQRNDSVCSSASGLLDTSSISECPSPQKPKEFNSVIQRKCRRTEQSRKLAEARRDFYLKFGNNKPDRQKLTMIDLIFYNPVTNPMSNDNKNKRKNSEVESENHEEVREEVKPDEKCEDDPGKTGQSDEENELPAPQIKIGPSGEIIIDEQSLVIENDEVKKSRAQLETSEVVNGDFDTGYGVFKRAKRSKDWSKHETLKFYKALNTIGTDFTLMCELFPRRTRRELKMKFKKEERVNKALVDKAIMQPCGFDFHDFKHQVEMEEKELYEIEKQKEREKEMKKEAKKRKVAPSKQEPPQKITKVEKPKPVKKKRPLDIMKVLEDDSDADESEIESLADEGSEENFLHTMQKPTRSGRVPKTLQKYKVQPLENNKATRAEPGSLIVMAATGASGQPVYKVCMVTGENGRRQIGDDLNSLEKALECKDAGITNLFTLTARPVSAPPESPPEAVEEQNITIPAEEEISQPKVMEMTEHEITNEI